jgi:hypothetical protein
MKHDVNTMVKLIMALKNFDHGNNKELIAHYKANVGRTDWEFGEVPVLVSAKPRTDAAYEKRKVYQRLSAYLGMDPSKVPMNISVHVDGRSPLGDAPLEVFALVAVVVSLPLLGSSRRILTVPLKSNLKN